jgi:FAD binding domain-containing protein
VLTLRRLPKDPPAGLDATQDTRTIRARWVVGADGANSFVRESRGITRRDLGFREHWLVVDVEPSDMTALDLPPACQWCDPRRPTTHIRSGTSHRRWEFMLLPGEQAADFEDPERVWALLAPWFGSQDGAMTRHCVYEFRSMLADRMRDGRVLIVGDAAHLTPPFLGQGLCSGLRDAANVAWKLDLVLRGLAGEGLLDSVDPERQPQNEWIITLAIELGRVLCQLDPKLASERDMGLRGADAPPEIAMAALSGGLVRCGPDGAPDGCAGRLAVQGTVGGRTGVGLLDDVTGGGFTLLAAAGNPNDQLAEGQQELLTALGARTVSLDCGDDCGVRDLDGRMTEWLTALDAHAVLIRPDFYVFGAAGSPGDLPALVDDLRDQLQPSTTATSAA